MRPCSSLLTLLTTCISLRRHSILSQPIILSLPSLYRYSYLLLFYPIYPFLFCLFGLSPLLFPQTYHSLYLANLHISPSRSAYHYHIPIAFFFGFSFDICTWRVLGNIIFLFVIKSIISRIAVKLNAPPL
ncbi:hypothetical protein ARMSODRAFT_347438 [Armillaria solidipes]|uniref:Uncharacterized protein n=1 Tax=Armillaria solidipes TaxID=1076256 RepID=A0A2H3BLD3_9AGAR|nr:hypothetical protein ARMSODRAFT_347438 [Armillaria solidipes]